MWYQASTLGIPASAAARYNPYPRGRGRGRGRARGGSNLPTRPMRLDNRTRVIVVTGEQAGTNAVKEYFERTGGNVEKVDGGEGVKIGYPTREMAERVSRFALGYASEGWRLMLIFFFFWE